MQDEIKSSIMQTLNHGGNGMVMVNAVFDISGNQIMICMRAMEDWSHIDQAWYGMLWLHGTTSQACLMCRYFDSL